MRSIYHDEQHESPIPRLALRPRETAVALGMSEKTIWTLTKEGRLPAIKVGTRVLYPIHLLRQWMDEQAQQAGESEVGS